MLRLPNSFSGCDPENFVPSSTTSNIKGKGEYSQETISNKSSFNCITGNLKGHITSNDKEKFTSNYAQHCTPFRVGRGRHPLADRTNSSGIKNRNSFDCFSDSNNLFERIKLTPIKGSSQPSASQSNDQNSEVIEFNTNDASGNRIGGHSSTRDEKQQSNSNLLLNKTPNRHTPSRQSTTDNLSLTNSQLRTSIHTHNHTHTHIHTHTPTRLATSNRHPHLQSPETLNTESVDIFSHDNRSRRPSLGGIPSSGTIEFYNRAIGGLHVRTPEAKQTNNPVTPTWFTLSSDLEENEGEEILNDQSKFIYDDPLGSGPSLTQRPRRYSGNKDAKVSNDNFQMESMKKELDDLKKAWNETISENKALYQLVKKALAEKQALQFQLRSVATTHMLYDVAKQEIADLKSELAKHSSCGCSKLIDFLSPNSKGKKETGNNK